MKLNKKWLAVILLVVMALCATAYGETMDKQAIVGQWKMDFEASFIADGYSAEEAKESAAKVDYTMVFEFTADGKMFFTKTYSDRTSVEEFLYTIKDDQLYLDSIYYAEGSSEPVVYYTDITPYRLAGDTLQVELDGIMVLRRVTEQAENNNAQGGLLDLLNSLAAAPAADIVDRWQMEVNGIEVIMDIGEDNKVRMYALDQLLATYDYTIEGNQLIFLDVTDTFELDGDTLTLHENGTTMIWTRCPDNDSIVGVWEVDMETLKNAFGVTEEDYKTAKAMLGYIAITYEFTADGKVIVTEITGEEKKTMGESTYIVDGNTVTIDGGKGSYKIEDNKLFVTDDTTGITLSFNRK